MTNFTDHAPWHTQGLMHHFNTINGEDKTMQKTVYMVWAGEYSDYKVVGIYTTMEKAEERLKLVDWISKGISPIQLDTSRE